MTVSELTVGEFLAALGERTPAPASGAATALTGAFAARLVELAARFAKDDAAVSRAQALSTRLTQLADEDAVAYTVFMETRTDEARRRRRTASPAAGPQRSEGTPSPQRDPKSLRIATLLDKPDRRQRPVDVHYVGFQIPDEFVVGYGLDYAEDYRNLKDVCVLSD